MNTKLCRKLMIAALVTLLMSSLVAVIPAQAQGVPGCPIYITMHDSLILRSQPSYASSITVTLPTGSVVCMFGRNSASTWVQLAYPNQAASPLGWGPASAFTTTVPITVLPVTDGSTVPTTPMPPTTPIPPTMSQTYTIQAGDTLYNISQKTGVLWTAIAQANNVQWPYTIYVGQVLVIPGTTGPATPPGYRQHVVQQGEYLVSIARLYNQNWVTLATINSIVYPYIILPGQTLLIPGQ